MKREASLNCSVENFRRHMRDSSRDNCEKNPSRYVIHSEETPRSITERLLIFLNMHEDEESPMVYSIDNNNVNTVLKLAS